MMAPEVYTLDDLVSRERLDAGQSMPARLAVLGWPIEHSASPRMHQPALDACGIAARYIRLAVAPGELHAAIERMVALDFIGCNITVPHKLEVMRYCEVDAAARALGAVNTLHFEKSVVRGFNTDGPGFAMAVAESFGAPLAGLRVAVVGAGGGAGQAIAAQCALLGVPELLLINRSVEKLGPLIERLAAFAHGTRIIPLGLDDPSLAAHCRGVDLIVNSTSVGLHAGDPAVLPSTCWREGQWVYDAIYGPSATPLLRDAQAHGCRTANGLSMLLHQGALAFQRWFPGSDPLPIMRMALTEPPP